MINFMRNSNIYKTGLVMLHLFLYFSKPKKVVMIATHLETCQFYFLPQADNHTFRLNSFCQDCPNFIVNFTHCYFWVSSFLCFSIFILKETSVLYSIFSTKLERLICHCISRKMIFSSLIISNRFKTCTR